jgi:hypothetical protein
VNDVLCRPYHVRKLDGGGPRLVQPAEMGQSGGERKMRAWVISIDLD